MFVARRANVIMHSEGSYSQDGAGWLHHVPIGPHLAVGLENDDSDTYCHPWQAVWASVDVRVCVCVCARCACVNEQANRTKDGMDG